MPLNTRLNKNVVVSKFLDLIKEADDGGLLKSVEYVQLEQLMSENLPKHNFLTKLVNKLITDSTNFSLNDLDRYNSISDEQDDPYQSDENSDFKIEQLEQHLNLIKNQKEQLECELMKLYNYELDDELSKEREQLNDLKMKLSVLFDEFKPLLNKRTDTEKTTKLDQQLLNRLDKLKEKKLQINELIEEIIMHVDLSLNRDKLVKLIEREYCLKLIQIKNVLENLKTETEFISKTHRNKMIKNTIWKVYLKDFKDEINNEMNLISCSNQNENTNCKTTTDSTTDSFDFEEFKEFLELSKNDHLDELLLIAKQTFKKVNN